MNNSISTNSLNSSLIRQAIHWQLAAERLSVLENLVSGSAWHGIEYNLGLNLKKTLQKSVENVISNAKSITNILNNSSENYDPGVFKTRINDLREQYLKAESTIHFYTIAINSRTTSNVAALLRACDILCQKSMEELLQPLGKTSPPVLTFIEKGLGASILKAGLRLWDGNISEIAAIKITQHNLFRPTAIIHETGHQISHILGWNEELEDAFKNNLQNHQKVVSTAFANWASEIAADAFGFVHTGFGSIAALHDVISGNSYSVFAYRSNDPHPISYVRVLLGLEMCRQFYGRGPWDDLEESFKKDYNIDAVNYPSVGLIRMCINALPEIVSVILKLPYRAFNGRSISQIIDPEKVSPRSLNKLEYTAGPALFTSHAWVWKECIRILALLSYKIGTGEGDLKSYYKLQEEFMLKLGFAVELN